MSDAFANLPSNLPQLIRRAAVDHPDRGISIFDGRGRTAERRTYAELYALAVEAAARFDALGVGPRQPVMVALPTSWEWMEAWLGLLLRGAWPVASAGATGLAAADVQLGKVDQVMAAMSARHVVTSEGFREQAKDGGYARAAAGAITSGELTSVSPTAGFTPPPVDAGDIAVLQLTSGSTGLPRAVMISHGNAVHNTAACDESATGQMRDPLHAWADSMTSWLPLYHDMGLVGCLLLPMLVGLELRLIRPPTFLARPMLWLRELGSHGFSFAPAPNFGYQLCLERIRPEQLDGADLSNFKVALTGAEMIRSQTASAFVESFAPFGFAPESFLPCYGLAEATLAVTFDDRGQGIRTLPAPPAADAGFALTDVVCVGRPVRDTHLRVTAPNGRELDVGEVGEVRIQGPGLFAGYFGDADATAESLVEGWYRTGDLGFLHRGELYLTGRIKDVLIVHGHNLMPDEIERLADGVTGGGGLLRSAAFSVAHGSAGEEAVLVVEANVDDPARLAEIEREIRIRIGRNLGLPVADVVFVRRGRIPRTTSGKMQRGEVRRRYLDGTLEVVNRES
jgi:acyl-CoA synthetase (AMP-forming)/AMP-acid ligase II